MTSYILWEAGWGKWGGGKGLRGSSRNLLEYSHQKGITSEKRLESIGSRLKCHGDI